MQKLIGKLKNIALVVIMSLFVSIQLPILAQAQEKPTIQLVSPAINSTVIPDTNFRITFRVLGGWVSKELSAGNPCVSVLWSNSSYPNLLTYIGATDENGTSKYLIESTNGSPVNPFMFKTTKVLENGLECSFDVTSNTRWAEGGSLSNDPKRRSEQAKFYGGTKMAYDATSYGPIKQFSFAWGWADSQEFSIVRVNSGVSAAPVISFKGIKTGDTINAPTKFSVLVEMGKSLSISDMLINASCSEFLLISENSVSKLFESACILNPAPLADNQEVIGINAEIRTTDYRSYKSRDILLNAGEVLKLGKPVLQLYTRTGTSSTSGFGAATSHYLELSGSFYLQKSNGREYVANQKFKLCLESNCREFGTDREGFFNYTFENMGTSPKYTITGDFRGVPITRDSLSRDTCISGEENRFKECTNDLSPITYSFAIPQKVAPAPALKVTFSTSHIKNPPKTVKWGKSFKVSIATKGVGGADCEMQFQNPGWPSRSGIKTFRLQAGKTTTVTVRPWIRIFQEYSLKYVCIPDGWPRINSDGSISIYDKRVGGTMGYVTLIP